MTVVLEADEIRYWCSSPQVAGELVDKGARVVVAAARAEDLGHLVDTAIPAEGLGQAPRG